MMANFNIARCIMQGGPGNLYEDAAMQSYFKSRSYERCFVNFDIVLKWSSLNEVRKVYGRQRAGRGHLS